MNEQLNNELKEAKEELEEYIQARVDLVKLHTAENLSKFFSGMLIKMGLFYLFFFVLLFVSLAGAFWLDRILDTNGAGFLIIAGIYLVFGLIFYALRKKLIEQPIIQAVIHLFFPNFKGYDED